MANIFFIVAHILAVMFGVVWLVFTVPFHLFYLNSKKSKKELQKQTSIMEKELKVKEKESKQKEESKKEEKSLSIADEIKKLSELKDSGILTEEEFASQKSQLLDKSK